MTSMLKPFSWLSLLFLLSMGVFADEAPHSPSSPDFPKGLDWLNVTRPLTLTDLRGKVVILDFWTYGCINCIHVMEDLKRLKRKYGNRLMVIGVHTPKFDNEQNLDNLRHILRRYDRDEPVVNDPDYLLMRRYRAPAWPTLVIIDPFGNYVGRVVGEGHYARLIRAIDQLLKIHKDTIDDGPLTLATPDAQPVQGWFGAPEKIAVRANRVAVSDGLLHRILTANLDGTIIQFVGGTEAGFKDGNPHEARFHSPHGLVFDRNGILYVADTGNHAIRQVDLVSGQVTTIAGTGHKGESLAVPDNSDPLSIALRSPWDLALAGSSLYIAMAGDHRIWHLDLDSNELRPFAGSGREGIGDGVADTATFSQPSGLALVGDTLYVADPEASAIRQINLLTRKVHTLAGSGLHDFGDRTGRLQAALLQHPQGVAPWTLGRLLVVDTYNHKLKLLDPQGQTIHTLLGNGIASREKNGAQLLLNEPGGLAAQGERVLIADTNNRRIIAFHPDTGVSSEWIPHQATVDH